MRKSKRVQRGEYGYIHYRQRSVAIRLLLLFVAAVAIFLTGLLLNHMSRVNIFTVVAILFVLPWAKQMVALIVITPYRSVSRERYEMVQKKVSDRWQEGVVLYTDMVISSPDKIMNLDFILAGHGIVLGLVGKEKQDAAYIRQYLTQGVGNWSDGYRVKIVEKEKMFLQELDKIKEKEIPAEEDENVKSYLRSLIV